MDRNRLAGLTERQKEVLRLVASGLEAKEIALALGISPSAVTERLRGARATLGVSSSRAAARMLLNLEAEDAYKRHVDIPPPLDAAPIHGETGVADGSGVVELKEEQAPFEVPRLLGARHMPLPFATKGAPRNDLSVLQVLLLIGVLLVAIVIGIAGAGSILRTLTEAYGAS